MSELNKEEEDDLLDYEDHEEPTSRASENESIKEVKKGSYAGIQAAGFRDFLLKPEILRAVGDCGFEHPSEVQQECIPQAILGADIVCQAKSGMGKTAVFVLATLQQIEPEDGVIDTLVICHTRELAFQICQEFDRFSKYFDQVKAAVMFGGIPEDQHIAMLQDDCPNLIVGTPGRILRLVERKKLKLDKLKRFILDECDKMLDSLDMRRDVQAILRHTPHEKQVMMFSATINSNMREVCRKFAQNPMEVFVDDESKLTLHGLQQYYVKLTETEKNRKLNDLLDALDFNQVVIFVKSQQRAKQLNRLLNQCAFPSMAIYSRLAQEERIARYQKFKEYKARILVSTDLFGRGVDIERVNIVINYDMPPESDTYLHRVGRAGRFGTKGLAITFVSTSEEVKILNEVQKRFEVEVKELPDQIDVSTYMTN